jgi:hypothetical protein
MVMVKALDDFSLKGFLGEGEDEEKEEKEEDQEEKKVKKPMSANFRGLLWNLRLKPSKRHTRIESKEGHFEDQVLPNCM